MDGSIFDLGYMIRSTPEILQGLPNTLAITLVSLVFGLMIGFLCALVRIYKVPVVRRIVGLYISFTRGTPLLVQIFLSYYGIPLVLRAVNEAWGTNLNVNGVPVLAFAFLAYSLNVGAYMTETVRAAILSVDQGQVEAAYAVGMTGFQTMRRIVLPQAAMVAIPNVGNSLISLFKDTSLVFTISVTEIMAKARIIGGRSFRNAEVFLAAALVYWVVSFLCERLIAWTEKHLRRGDARRT
jgi:His/Glu/Gln/Arg/opine family amino acid ABC transporter permease subunit